VYIYFFRNIKSCIRSEAQCRSKPSLFLRSHRISVNIQATADIDDLRKAHIHLPFDTEIFDFVILITVIDYIKAEWIFHIVDEKWHLLQGLVHDLSLVPKCCSSISFYSTIEIQTLDGILERLRRSYVRIDVREGFEGSFIDSVIEPPTKMNSSRYQREIYLDDRKDVETTCFPKFAHETSA